MHFRNRVLAAAAVVAMAVFAVLGSTKEMGEKKSVAVSFLPNDHKETIYFGYSDEALTSYINSAAVAFGERENVHVIPVLLENQAYLEKINDMTLNDASHLPDAYVIANDSLERAYLAGLSSPVEDADDICNEMHFPKTALQAVTYQGLTVAYPFYYETSVLVYNQTYLNQWVKQQEEKVAEADPVEEGADEQDASDENTQGADEAEPQEEEEYSVETQISPEGVPYTMEALLYIADTFDVPEGVEGIMEWDVSDIFYNYWFVGNYLVVGGENGDDPSMIDINNPQNIECMEFYKSLHQFFSIETETVTYDACIQDLIDGKIVFTIADNATVKKFEEAKETGDFSYDYGFAVLPQISKDLKSKNMSVTYAVAVNGYSKHKELANRFAAYLTEENAGELYDRTGKYTANTTVTEKPYAAFVFDKAYSESVSLPKLMEIGNLWLQLETLFAKIWNGEETVPLVEELTGQVESQLIMR